MPVSGAQHAWLHDMLQAAVHSMNMRPGYRPASSERTVRLLTGREGPFQRAVAAERRTGAVEVFRSVVMTGPRQISSTDAVRVSPSTRVP
jgi:hypothetical protein